MTVPRMSMKEFESILNNVTSQIETTQAKKDVSIDIKTLVHDVHACNEFILQNKTILFDPSNRSIEQFLEAAKWFLPFFQREKSTQEKMGALIAALWPLSDEIENLKKNLLQRRIVKRRYGDQVEKVEKEQGSQKEKK